LSELQKSIDVLTLRLDRMALRVETAVHAALEAVSRRDVDAGRRVSDDDSLIDAEEVAIEEQCIRLLALYQPTAVDLRTLCFIIKANNDLERIADKAAGIGRRVRHLVAESAEPEAYAEWAELVHAMTGRLHRTLRTITSQDIEAAREVIATDADVDRAYRAFARRAIADARTKAGGVDVALTQTLLARALERIGDLCTNIAEDVVFLCTGQIIRHAHAEETA
jgi:phosphate transport system protein